MISCPQQRTPARASSPDDQAPRPPVSQASGSKGPSKEPNKEETPRSRPVPPTSTPLPKATAKPIPLQLQYHLQFQEQVKAFADPKPTFRDFLKHKKEAPGVSFKQWWAFTTDLALAEEPQFSATSSEEDELSTIEPEQPPAVEQTAEEPLGLQERGGTELEEGEEEEEEEEEQEEAGSMYSHDLETEDYEYEEQDPFEYEEQAEEDWEEGEEEEEMEYQELPSGELTLYKRPEPISGEAMVALDPDQRRLRSEITSLKTEQQALKFNILSKDQEGNPIDLQFTPDTHLLLALPESASFSNNVLHTKEGQYDHTQAVVMQFKQKKYVHFLVDDLPTQKLISAWHAPRIRADISPPSKAKMSSDLRKAVIGSGRGRMVSSDSATEEDKWKLENIPLDILLLLDTMGKEEALKSPSSHKADSSLPPIIFAGQYSEALAKFLNGPPLTTSPPYVPAGMERVLYDLKQGEIKLDTERRKHARRLLASVTALHQATCLQQEAVEEGSPEKVNIQSRALQFASLSFNSLLPIVAEAIQTAIKGRKVLRAHTVRDTHLDVKATLINSPVLGQTLFPNTALIKAAELMQMPAPRQKRPALQKRGLPTKRGRFQVPATPARASSRGRYTTYRGSSRTSRPVYSFQEAPYQQATVPYNRQTPRGQARGRGSFATTSRGSYASTSRGPYASTSRGAGHTSSRQQYQTYPTYQRRDNPPYVKQASHATSSRGSSRARGRGSRK